MSNDVLEVEGRKAFGWHEETMQIRGCRLSIECIKELYRELSAINRKFIEQLASGLERDLTLSELEWTSHRQKIIDDASRLSIIIYGFHDRKFTGEFEEIFNDPNIPKPIESIFITNVTSFQRHANGAEPMNRIYLHLDFGKPPLLDPNLFVSEQTPNEGKITIKANDITFFSAAQKAVEKHILARKTWYSIIHKNFAYDFGMWLVAAPLSLYLAVYYMEEFLPKGGSFEAYRWPFFVYLTGIFLVVYRGLIAYAKWAFPVNILEDNKDRAWKHRFVLGAFSLLIIEEAVSAIRASIAG